MLMTGRGVLLPGHNCVWSFDSFAPLCEMKGLCCLRLSTVQLLLGFFVVYSRTALTAEKGRNPVKVVYAVAGNAQIKL